MYRLATDRRTDRQRDRQHYRANSGAVWSANWVKIKLHTLLYNGAQWFRGDEHVRNHTVI